MLIKIPKGWEIPDREATPESVYLNRRNLLKAAGFLGMEGLLQAASVYPAKRNPQFTLDRPITEEWAATGYNNFYEFGTDKEGVKNKVGAYKPRPWTINVSGLVNKPKIFDIDTLERTMPLEERLYRHRCVERWAMAVPWTGFVFSELIKQVEPKSTAKWVRFVSVHRPAEMPGIPSQNWYPWPYFEALRMDEAMNPLTLMVTGMYGKELPKQNGAPLRIHCPWKYGYKSPKAIVMIEFTDKQPGTFWNKLQPAEYGFYSNVNPKKPHPRWSQATDMVIPTGERRPTLMYNGYERYVSAMYKGNED